MIYGHLCNGEQKAANHICLMYLVSYRFMISYCIFCGGITSFTSNINVVVRYIEIYTKRFQWVMINPLGSIADFSVQLTYGFSLAVNVRQRTDTIAGNLLVLPLFETAVIL